MAGGVFQQPSLAGPSLLSHDLSGPLLVMATKGLKGLLLLQVHASIQK